MKNVVLFELNEVPFRVIDDFCRRRPHSALAELLARAEQFTTVCKDRVELDPWISWPTLHRGVNDERHGIYHLGQILDETDRAFPPLWRILADAGRRVGVFGSVHSNQIPERVGDYAFYVPDFFDDKAFAHPDYLLPFQRFNLGMTRRSARNVDTAVPRELAFDFLKSLPRFNVSRETIASIVRQLVDERRTPRLRLRRRSLQFQIMGDVFLSLMKSRRPEFATFYTNHVAASMHRYWAAAFPDDLDENSMPAGWRKDYAGEIFEAMATLDKMLARLKRWIDSRGDTILMIASSMGQVAVKHRPTDGGYTIRNMDRFMAAMGLNPAQFHRRHAMSPCSGVVVTDDAKDVLKSRLDQMSINGKRFVESDREVYPLSYGIYEGNFFSFFTYFENYAGEHVATIGNRRYSFEEIGFGFFAHEDGVAVSAHHHPDGILLVYDPRRLPMLSGRPRVSTTEIAPALIEHFNGAVPAYMSQPGGLVRRVLLPDTARAAA